MIAKRRAKPLVGISIAVTVASGAEDAEVLSPAIVRVPRVGNGLRFRPLASGCV
jgi:hypothetical protein